MVQSASAGLEKIVAETSCFEDLLLKLSAYFINLPASSIDRSIEQVQRLVCRSLELDLSALWQWSENDSSLFTVTHMHSPPEGPERPVDIDASATFPYIFRKMMNGEVLAFSTDELPEEAEVDKNTRRHFNIVSSVDIPLMAAGSRLLGVLTFDTVGREKMWDEMEVRRLQLVAEIFLNALLRKKFETELLKEKDKMNLAVHSAEAGLWELDYKTGQVWVSEKIYDIFGFNRGHDICIDDFAEAIHPEDWKAISKALDSSFASGEKFKLEYRLKGDLQTSRWVCSRGNPYFNLDGSPNRMLGISIDVTERKNQEETIQRQYAELKNLKKQLEQENIILRKDLVSELGFENVIGRSRQFTVVLNSAKHVADTMATVLVLGETGTGKGLIAHLIHQMSGRKNRPFVTVNCAALPRNLIESELFGRAKGAFTGADSKQAGRFEIANRGTIFLDEIGEMDLEMQAKLLRVLQDGEFERLGSPQTIKVDVRVIAATARDLKQDVAKGLFREDLFYRLNVFPITLPPLRERKDDIALLASYFVKKYNRRIQRNITTISRRTLELMENYSWPGNVRELEHLIERSVIVSSGSMLAVSSDLLVQPTAIYTPENVKDLASHERDHILEALDMTNWKIEGRDGAAATLDVHPSTLRYKLKKFGIKRPA